MVDECRRRAGRTDPDADTDDHGDPWGAVPEGFQRVHSDIAAVATHGRQRDAGGLDGHLMKTRGPTNNTQAQ